MPVYVDISRCIGCRSCEVACKQENGTPMDVFFARVLNVEPDRTEPPPRDSSEPNRMGSAVVPSRLRVPPTRSLARFVSTRRLLWNCSWIRSGRATAGAAGRSWRWLRISSTGCSRGE